MFHVRKQIRDSIISALINNTDAGSNVFSNRVHAIVESERPNINVFTLEEQSSDNSVESRISKRTLRVAVDTVLDESVNLEDELDKFALQIENLIHDLNESSDVISSISLISTDFDISGAELENQIVGMRQVFEIKYVIN